MYCVIFSSQVFWIGDLNYRLSDIDNEKVKKQIQMENLQPLMDHDQVGGHRHFIYHRDPILGDAALLGTGH